jgi:predicted enzyme involved in methoxymalonyl-ACP biosynthesis
MPATAEHDTPAAAAAAVRTRRRSLPTAPPALTVGLLASYTINPIEPYLHVALADAGLVPEIVVGPFDQILPECLDDRGRTAELAPDALVVSPRWEEMPDGEEEDELLRLADVAVAAADRRETCLVFVLPALPQDRAGAADAGRPDGIAATVTAARQRLRDRLAGHPHVLVADAEEAVRDVGALRAHHPALHAFARIPYTEEVFWRLGLGVARLLRVRFGGVPRAVVLGDDVLTQACAEFLRDPLLRLSAAGTRLATTAPDDAVLAALRGEWAPLAPHLLDGRSPDAEPLPELTGRLGPSVLLTADPELAAGAAAIDGLEPVLLGAAAENWPAELQEAGVFDRPLPGRSATAGPAPARDSASTWSLEEFVASLNVSVTFDEPDGAVSPKVTELLARAKDFVLGPVPDGFDPADVARAEDRLLLAASVRDRFGDHGLGAVAALAFDSGVCSVEVFSVSCPVMGRGVEPLVLQEIAEIAGRRGCGTVELVLTPTGRNDVALDFAAEACARAWEHSGGTVAVRAVERR